jgi:Ca-activated chloride channel family protein
MKIPTMIALTFVGMALTSLTVWLATAPGRATLDPEPAPSAQPDEPGPRFRVDGPVALEGRLGHRVLAAEQAATTYLYAEMTATTGKVAKTPAPLDLAIVIDRSGSMRGQRLQNAIDAAQGAVRRLRDGDRVSVAAYNTMVEDVVAPTTIDASTRDRVVAAIGTIAAAGDTCISCGLETGLARVQGRTGMVRRLLLLSDGEATAGVREVAGFKAIAARCREAGVSITSIGVDTQYNERVMAALALESNGRHYFVENAASLPAVFDKELASLNKTLAMDAEIVVTPAPGITVEQVYDRTHRIEGNQVVVPLGTFAESERKTLLVALRTPANRAGQLDVARVELRYRDLTENDQAHARGELALRLTDDPGEVSDLDVVVENRVNRSKAGDALEEANALYRAGKRDEARRKLQEQIDAVKQAEARSARAPAKPKAKVDADYERQRRALEDADDAFSDSAAKGAPAPAPDTQVRANQDWAAESRL